jgi:hypothetical protein
MTKEPKTSEPDASYLALLEAQCPFADAIRRLVRAEIAAEREPMGRSIEYAAGYRAGVEAALAELHLLRQLMDGTAERRCYLAVEALVTATQRGAPGDG